MRLTIPALPERLRERLPRRGVAVALALIVEALILLLFLSFVPALLSKEKRKPLTFGFETGGESDEPRSETAKKAKAKGGASNSQPQPQPQPVPEPPTPRPLTNSKWASRVIWLSRPDYAASDIANRQGTAARSNEGEGNSDAPDSALAAGRGPRGEPLYAAEWYREPTNAQLNPYVPERMRGRAGWGVVACRTAPNYRVEDCQELDDSPRGSGYAGAVRQAAWQFRVRPPRVGGKPLVGSWVRILIHYTLRDVPKDEGPEEEPQ